MLHRSERFNGWEGKKKILISISLLYDKLCGQGTQLKLGDQLTVYAISGPVSKVNMSANKRNQKNFS